MGTQSRLRVGGRSTGGGERARWWVAGVAVLATVGGSTVALTGAAHAAVPPIVVTTDADGGPGSLRAALDAAASSPSDDTVTFSGVTGTITLTGGELATTVGGTSGNLEIDGPGANDLAIDAGGLSRVLSITGSGGVVRPTALISGLTLTGGSAPVEDQNGGAVQASGADLTLAADTVSHSRSGGSGGGVSVVGGSLTVQGSLVTANTVTTNIDFGYRRPELGGGGLSVDAAGAAGVALAVTDSTVSDNTAQSRGGGIRTFGTASATLRRSTVSGNVASATLNGQDVTATIGLGGGISAPDLTLVDSSVVDNRAGAAGGGVDGRSVTVRGSTISGNRADAGGGLDVEGTAPGAGLQVTSSTVWGNRGRLGGGVYVTGDLPVDLTLSTVAANEVGGGLDTTTDVSVKGSILATNQGGDLIGSVSATATLSHSLVQDTRDVAHADTGGSILARDPLLGPLGDHGGATQTSLPALNSPVIDQGDAFGETVDQRGAPRPTDDPQVPDAVDGSDMGAVELTAEEQAGLPQVANTARPTLSGTLKVGKTLHTGGGAWSPVDATRSYQWFRSGTAIPGATAASYHLTGADLHAAMSVRVTAGAPGHRDGSAISDESSSVRVGDLRVTEPASLAGRLRVGSTLHARARLGAIFPRPAAAYYSWVVHGRYLPHAHASTLRLKRWMRGDRVRVVISYATVPGFHRLVQVVRGSHPVR